MCAMAAEIGVVPRQPKRRVVMRRVKLRRLAGAAAISAGSVGIVSLFDVNGSTVLQASIALLVASMFVAAILALVFALTEKRTAVEIVEDSWKGGLIHLSGGRQSGPQSRSDDP